MILHYLNNYKFFQIRFFGLKYFNLILIMNSILTLKKLKILKNHLINQF